MCGGPTQKHSVVDLPQTNVFGNFPAPCNLTSLDENKTEEIILYPNPAQDYITIDIPATYNKSTLQILNVQGHFVYSQTVVAGVQNIQLDNLANGLYMVTIQADGKQSFTRRLIIAE